MKSLVLTFLTFVSISSFGQDDHLLPADGFFSLYKHERDYYPYVYKHLFKDLSDAPLARVVTLPSFSPENVLSVESMGKDDKIYKVIYVIGKESIWSRRNRNTLEVVRYEEPIDSSLANIIGGVFKKATSQARYLNDDSWGLGLDGVTYMFSTFVIGQGNRAGKIWSPDEGTRMNQLVEFAEVMILFAKSANDRDREKFKKEIKEKGERLLAELER